MVALKIAKFSIQNFRNLGPSIFEFGPGINCIFGKNGNGKTNLLEAIYFAYHRKSFRKKCSFPEMLSFDSEHAQIFLALSTFEGGKEGPQYCAKFIKNKSLWAQHTVTLKKRPEIPSVFINPVDSYPFHTSNRMRRDWFDHHFCLLSKNYRKALTDYVKAIKIRNILLERRPSYFTEQIRSIDEGLSILSCDLTTIRGQFLGELNQLIEGIFQKLFNESHQLRIQLQTGRTVNTVEAIFKSLQDGLATDLRLGRTLNGPHRDNYLFSINQLSTESYASLGQQKMAYLSLIFAYIELFRYKFDSYPILLIDDVSGELDRPRWQRLMEYLKERTFQVFLTTANENFRNLLIGHDVVTSMNLENGRVAYLDDAIFPMI